MGKHTQLWEAMEVITDRLTLLEVTISALKRDKDAYSVHQRFVDVAGGECPVIGCEECEDRQDIIAGLEAKIEMLEDQPEEPSGLVERVARGIAESYVPPETWEDWQIKARAAIREVADVIDKHYDPSGEFTTDPGVWLRSQVDDT